MAIMNEATKKRVGQVLSEKLQHPVTIALFTAETPETQEYVDICRELSQGLVEMGNGLLALREIDVVKSPADAQQYGVDKVPAFALLNGNGGDTHFRIYGAPMGYAFSVLLDDLIDVSQQQTRLSEATRDQLKAIDQDVMIQVFSTPT